MRKELLKPVLNAIFALLLLGMVKIVAMFMLKEVNGLLTYIDIALSLAVVIVFLKFMMEFNRQLENNIPGSVPGSLTCQMDSYLNGNIDPLRDFWHVLRYSLWIVLRYFFHINISSCLFPVENTLQ